MKKFIYLIVIFLIIFISYLYLSILAQEQVELVDILKDISKQTAYLLNATKSEMGKSEEQRIIKASFWKINREKLEKGEFIGSVLLKGGKLIINLKDEKLKKILQSPYTTMAGELREGIARDWLVTYQPGTVSHLRAIVSTCWQWGYIGKLEE